MVDITRHNRRRRRHLPLAAAAEPKKHFLFVQSITIIKKWLTKAREKGSEKEGG
jgi:hypothetical protein